MGSQQQEELTVLVTGFGPFREQYPVNPSWEIAKGLPSHLPPLRAKALNSRDAIETPPVRILVHQEPIRVSYKVVRELAPSFWQDTYQGHHVDIAIHIGMAGPRPMYQIERRGHRTGYKSPDVDGETPEDEGDGTHDLPDELLTDLSAPDILQRWQGHSSKDMDLRISDDAGRYLCDFIYFSSLSTLYKQKRARKVLFLHVPSDASERSVARGRELAVNLIRSVVESEVSKQQSKEAGGT